MKRHIKFSLVTGEKFISAEKFADLESFGAYIRSCDEIECREVSMNCFTRCIFRAKTDKIVYYYTGNSKYEEV